MVSVSAPVEEVHELLARWPGRVGVAGVNGPFSVVVSGRCRGAAGLVAECAVQGVRTRMIPVDYASHSIQVEAVR